MIIDCPGCAVTFEVPDEALGEFGRKVRCSKCAFMWTAKLPKPPREIVDNIPSLESLEGLLTHEKHSIAKRINPIFHLKAFAFAAMLLLTSGLGVLLYQPSLLGIHSSDGLSFEHLTLKKMPDIGGERFSKVPVYAIIGAVKNHTDSPRNMPTLKILFKTPEGETLYARYYTADETIIGAHESVNFMPEKLSVPNSEHGQFTVQLGNQAELLLRQVQLSHD